MYEKARKWFILHWIWVAIGGSLSVFLLVFLFFVLPANNKPDTDYLAEYPSGEDSLPACVSEEEWIRLAKKDEEIINSAKATFQAYGDSFLGGTSGTAYLITKKNEVYVVKKNGGVQPRCTSFPRDWTYLGKIKNKDFKKLSELNEADAVKYLNNLFN